MHRFVSLTIGLSVTFASVFGGSLFTPSDAAEKWVKVVTVKNERQRISGIFFVDVNSIEIRGRIRSYWASLIFDKPVKSQISGSNVMLYKAVSYISVDCQNKANYRVHETAWFDRNNKILSAVNFAGISALLDLRGDRAVVNYVCNQRK
jgi:hypothetical protein